VNTPVPPAAPTAAKPGTKPAAGQVVLEDTAFQGGFRNAGDSQYRGRTATWVYGSRTQYSKMTAQFELPFAPREADLVLVGLDSEGSQRTNMAIYVNDVELYRGRSPFPDDRPDQPQAPWTERRLQLPGGALRPGANTVTIQNLEDSANVGSPPFVAIDQVTVRYQP
jgi:hypothetical protein